MEESFENKSEILSQVQAGKLSAAEGLKLLKQLKEPRKNARMMRCYQPVWRDAPLSDCTNIVTESVNDVMIIFDQDNKHWKMVEEKGQKAVLVLPGEAFEKITERSYTVCPDSYGDYEELMKDLENQSFVISGIIHLWSFLPVSDLENSLKLGFLTVINLAQAIEKSYGIHSFNWLYVYPDEVIHGPENEAIAGFFQSLHREYPSLCAKSIAIPLESNEHFYWLFNEVAAQEMGVVEVRYSENRRYIRGFEESGINTTNRSQLWKEGGFYLITGGGGGLGLLIAENVLKHYNNIRILLVGRSLLSEELEERVRILRAAGSDIRYLQVDVSKQGEVKQLFAQIKTEGTRLNGVVHAAGMIRDNALNKIPMSDLNEVLASKVFGTKWLDQALEEEKVDFLILFSSMISWIGNEGQSVYGFANRYLDAFAEYWSRRARETNVSRITLSIAWSPWLEGGMKVPDSTIRWMEKRMGIVPLGTNQGWQALEYALVMASQDKGRQFIVLDGTEDNVVSHKGGEILKHHDVSKQTCLGAGDGSAEFKEKTEAYLKGIFADELHVPISKIKSKDVMENYGIDSVLVVALTRRLEVDLGPLSKTIFFEYQTVGELVDYFLLEHQEHLDKMFKTTSSTAILNSQPVATSILENNSLKNTSGIATSRFQFGVSSHYVDHTLDMPFAVTFNEPIAVIGMSGRYPMANDLDSFWNNLKSGKDCITEIPRERWNYEEWFDSDKTKEGTIYTKWGGFLDDIDRFDPLFFQISPKEAELMDPQERLFLETVWHTLEDAGYTRRSLDTKKVGVYVGVMYGQYQLFGVEETHKGHPVAPSSSFASIANRVSYIFDFQGPSLALDTMCSSSLTAIHLACDSLRKGESEVAIAGGVNISIHPSKYLFLSQGKFASTDGRCRSFGAGGDGYVPGEGVGAVMLKPLSKAVADGDHIYGLIRGSALNHGGKTNGYTVPNPKAQGQVIVDALRQAKVSPDQISYIEAHGTGTSLGDPIEITGLNKVLSESGKKLNSCAIGSVKSNIGHLESAAGIAGLTKVLLQMKHKQLAPSIHTDSLNPNIDFAQSALSVQRTLTPWDPNEGSRIAGISSFGAGGANAHLVVEEWRGIDDLQEPINSKTQLVILSARNYERLQAYAQRLLTYLTHHDGGYSLRDLAYTLQVGREEMEERLAIISRNPEELIQKLNEWLTGGTQKNEIYSGNCKQGDENNLLDEDTYSEFVQTLLVSKNIASLAQVWIRGAGPIDWNLLYEDSPHRIPLPCYPFKRNRYWIGNSELDLSQKALNTEIRLHPLIGTNDSTFDEQTYSTIFSGREWIIRDHKIDGNFLLPGSAAVEIACAAGEMALNRKIDRIREVKWRTPVTFSKENNEKKVSISLYPIDNDSVEFILWSGQRPKEQIIYCTGILEVSSDVKKTYESEIIPLSDILTRCDKRLDADICYKRFAEKGLQYGESFQSLLSIQYGNTESLAELLLPEHLMQEAGKFGIHPALLDGAFQAIIGLFEKQRSEGYYLPFGFEELHLVGDISRVHYAYVCEEAIVAGTDRDPIERHFNIRLADKQGLVVADIRRFTIRKATSFAPDTTLHSAEDQGETMSLMRPVWIEEPSSKVISFSAMEGDILLFDRGTRVFDVLVKEMENVGSSTQIILIEPGNQLTALGKNHYIIPPASPDAYIQLNEELLRLGRKPAAVIHLWSQTAFDLRDNLDEVHNESLYSLHSLVKGLVHSKSKISTRLLYVYHSQGKEQPVYSAISGWLKTLTQEHPAFKCQSVSIDNAPELCINQWLPELFMEKSGTPIIRFSKGKRLVRKLQPMPFRPSNNNMMPIDPRGAYIITGGAGGLGMVFAKELATNYPGIGLVLTGRSDETVKLKEQMKELHTLNTDVRYMKADLSKRSDVDRLVTQVKLQYGVIRGILHCAGVISDGLIFTSNQDEMARVLAPKVSGSVLLDEATKDERLDFFVLFSSLTGEIGNPGQSSYAYANSFLDSFSKWRFDEEQEGRRNGHSISINWPLWKDGGMRIDKPLLALLQERLPGLQPLDTENGLSALRVGLQTNEPQLVVVQGDPAKMSWLTNDSEARIPNIVGNKLDISLDHTAVISRIELFTKELLSREIKLNKSEISVIEAFEEYGVDSIMIMNMTTALEKKFGPLSKTLFFEYRTIQELSNYLLVEHESKAIEQFGTIHQNSDSYKEERKEKTERNFSAEMLQQKNSINFQELNTDDKKSEPIAIIGISGCYPSANNLQTFWENLKSGLDSITEIPGERWDHNLYFNPDKLGKGTAYSKWGGFIDGIDCFDPLLFNISPREAKLIDPQERLFLQTVWHTLEESGYTKSRLDSEKVGVFVGAMYAQYQMLGMGLEGREVPASSFASIANRVSYFFNFRGPSLALDTMCSSSLTAIHLACQSIQQGESDVAIAGGVNLSLHPHKYVLLSQGKFSSTDGRCRAFGEGGDGYVPGEGIGAVLLKPLQKALLDGDHIHAIIRASTLNHGGRTNGYSVPDPNAQGELIAEAIRKANIDPKQITYVEAHGTGTALGDPIEIAGLSKAFGKKINGQPYCAIGSVKSNIGHLESAAGIAGLTKILLQMKHKQLVPSLHADTLNPNINFEETPFYVQRELTEWKQPILTVNNVDTEMPRMASLSSFGAGGSNAHLILEEWDKGGGRSSDSVKDDQPQLILLSARNEESLKQIARNLANALKSATIGAVPAIDGLQLLQKEIQQLAASVLNVESTEITVQEELQEFGFDQVSFGKLGEVLRDSLGLPHNELDFYKYTSVEALSIYLWEQQHKTINDRFTYHSPIESGDNIYSLSDIAYTLQVGREVLEERWAAVVTDQQDLLEQLKAFTEGSDMHEHWLRGTVKKGRTIQFILGDDEDSRELIERWTLKGKLDKLAELWISGVNIDWFKLGSNRSREIISLPLYPFAKERYWIESVMSGGNHDLATPGVPFEHPFLDGIELVRSMEQTGLVYHKTFLSSDNVLRDHIIKGYPTLPGAVLIEMVIEAYKQMSGCNEAHLAKIIWMVPVIVQRKSLSVRVEFTSNKGALHFSLRSGENEQLVTYAKGEVLTTEGYMERLAILPLDEIRTRCTFLTSGSQVYSQFEQREMHYGAYYMSILEISGNENEALSEVRIPDMAMSDLARCTIAPSLLDAALQTIAGIKGMSDGFSSSQTLVPFSVQNITIHKSPQRQMFAHVIKVEKNVYNVSLCDHGGNVYVYLKNVELREMSHVLHSIEKQVKPKLQEQIIETSPASAAQEKLQTVFSAVELQIRAETVIRSALSSVLHIDNNEFDNDMPYMDFGVDSVLSIEIINRINEQLSISLRSVDLFNYGSIRQLSSHLVTEYAEEINGNLNNSQPTDWFEPQDSNIQEQYSPDIRSLEIAESSNDIAIIGMSGRFPGADSVNEFWENLSSGVNTVEVVSRWNENDYYDEDRQKPDKSYSKWMGQLSNTDQFDPLFFSISPKEAEMMDPQQRIFLMEAWRSIEDAGYSISDLENQKCGVFVGCGSGDYMDLMKEHGVVPSAYAFMGNDESILPARISYFLNIKGPSIAVNTACSSSLVALHLACESIRCGTSDLALAGGISVLNTPRVHVLSSRAGMLSPDGQCKAFDDQANGFVPSEGVGVVLLKPLKAALADGDHIYGVIKGSGINQDGRTNGITAPSAPSQTALELDVYKQFGIHPSDIQYVEAHGTGTKLGDPIEIAALTDAFRKYTNQKGFCAIGSVKSNIGHALPAAGVAGLIKVLLSLKHRKLAPSVLVDKENEHIDFANSPFFVNKSLCDWIPKPGKPRMAAISSFGFSGTNAHVVIQESPVVVNNPILKRPYEFVPVSAASDRVLRQKERDLLTHLEGEGRGVPFENVVYTLQTGRSHFSVRHGFIVRDIDDLCTKLRERLEGSISEGFVEGIINQKRAEHSEQEQQLGTSIMKRLSNSTLPLETYKELTSQIASLFVKGVELNLHRLHSKSDSRRVSLPTYPFQLQRCWFEVQTQANLISGEQSKLLGKRSGDILVTRLITPMDNIVCHHRVSGRKLFPGSGFLALADQALIDLNAEREFSVADVIFLRPLVVQNEPIELKMRLVEHSPLLFEMITEQQGTVTVHVTGEFIKNRLLVTPGSIEHLSIEDIRTNCNSIYQDEGIYNQLQDIGLEYGPTFRGIKQLWGGEIEALGQLEIPDSCRTDRAFGRFHPAFLDAALHTISGLNHSGQPLLPFSLNSVEVFRPLQQKGYAHVSKEGERSYTVQVTDEVGCICLIVRGLVLVEVNNKEPDIGDSIYTPHWKLSALSTFGKSVPENSTVLIIGPETDSGLQSALTSAHMGCNVINVHFGKVTSRLSSTNWIIRATDTEAFSSLLAEISNIDIVYFLGGMQTCPALLSDRLEMLEQSQQEGVLSLFRLVKSLSSLGKGGQSITLKVVTNLAMPVHSNHPHLPNGASMHGFVKSLAKEYPSWKVSIIDIDLTDQLDPLNSSNKVIRLADEIVLEPANPRGEAAAIRAGERYQCVLKPLPLRKPDSIPFRHNGVYMILGGAGGIGMELGKYLSKVVQARVVLVGRRALDHTIELGLKEICSLGGEAHYLQADALDPSSMSRVVNQIKEKYSCIHGAVHSAIVLRDRIIENMSESDFRASLDTKVKGSAVLRQALADEPLDFVLFFSSIQSFSGNPGQSNYAAGCTFKDVFAHEWNAQVAYPVLTINWGYWGTVGVVSSDAYNQRLKAMGVQSIGPQEGMEVVIRTIANRSRQVLAFKAESYVLDQLGVETDILSSLGDGQPNHFSDWPALDEFQRKKIIAAFNELATFGKDLLLNSFRRMGVFLNSSERYDSAMLLKQLKIIPKYARLFGAMLKILENSGLLKQENGHCVTTSMVDTVSVFETFDLMKVRKSELSVQYPDIKAHLELLWNLFQNYGEILTGVFPATDIMFPKGSSILVENIYKNNEMADYFNRIVAHSVQVYLKKTILQGRKLKILEIGAGTGGTTAQLLPCIEKYSANIEYVYSDISFGFTQYGRSKFESEFPFVTFKTLDIEKDFRMQGYEEAEFDLILATNVLHATRHINRALGHCRTLLRDGGQLIVNELTEVHDFATLTFGLLDGWWLYEDEEVRLADAPLLSADRWIRQYEDLGFAEISAYGAEQLGQNVILGSKSTLINNSADRTVHELDEEGVKEYIQQILRDNLQKAMGIGDEDIHEERVFSTYGVDSISGVDLIKKINEDLGIVLRTTILFDYSSLKELTGYIWNEFGNELMNRKQKEAGIVDIPNDHLKLLEKLAEGNLSVNEVIKSWK